MIMAVEDGSVFVVIMVEVVVSLWSSWRCNRGGSGIGIGCFLKRFSINVKKKCKKN